MTITYNFYNSIDSKNILVIELPWEYKRAIKGFYSNIFKDFKRETASISKIDKRFIRAAIKRLDIDSDRFKITLRSGVTFNAPFDLTPIDFKIINLHLDALQLTLK